ncbi:hypothetical protein [Gluconacetobacter azotocaptans]|uniref:hypothetical protein n=1 Tax=Gluconacetobacter azotocaptans TaxID=142834 RepID=UPI00195AD75D|nr:hypothetical protein [Gluconacetobacter azotocaptans]
MSARVRREPRAKRADFDPAVHLPPNGLALLRGPFVRQPGRENPNPDEWLRWAKEIEANYALAMDILAAAGRPVMPCASK